MKIRLKQSEAARRLPAMIVMTKPMKAMIRLQQPVRKAQEMSVMVGHFCLEGKGESLFQLGRRLPRVIDNIVWRCLQRNERFRERRGQQRKYPDFR
jgi:hypothetical protein